MVQARAGHLRGASLAGSSAFFVGASPRATLRPDMTVRPDMTDPILIVRPSLARRCIGVGVQLCLGIVLMYVALVMPTTVGGLTVLLGLGVLASCVAVRTWVVSAGALILRADGIFDQTGRPIALLAQIDSVDRGAFSFKPSNGFLIRMKTSEPWAWVPGIWWRCSRRVGIGGVLAGAQTRAMADMLCALVAGQCDAAARDGNAASFGRV